MPRKRDAAEEEIRAEEATQEAAEEEIAVDSPQEQPGQSADGQPQEDRTAQLEAEVNDWRDRCLRAVAEMENVRRRAARDAEDAISRSNERFVADLLPVLDNFTRALEAAEQFSDIEGLKSGVAQIHRQLMDVVTRQGLERIEAVGQPFDPNLHEAIMQVEPQEGQEPNHVVEELRAGYKLNDRVIRPPLVKVTAS